MKLYQQQEPNLLKIMLLTERPYTNGRLLLADTLKMICNKLGCPKPYRSDFILPLFGKFWETPFLFPIIYNEVGLNLCLIKNLLL